MLTIQSFPFSLSAEGNSLIFSSYAYSQVHYTYIIYMKFNEIKGMFHTFHPFIDPEREQF